MDSKPFIPDFPIKESDYSYSDTIYVRKWAGGHISVKVGYVKKHPEKHIICLEKVWRGSGGKEERQNFNIKDGKDWVAIKTTIEKLWPEMGVESSKQDIDNAIEKVSRETELLELIAKYPDLLKQTKDIDILLLPPSQKEAFIKLLSVGGNLAQSVIEKLSAQPIKDLAQFVELLEQLKLSTINSLVTHVTSRLGFIDMFEKVILDDKSFERRGINSVHNLLKANIWIIDRNYSILHDDETLKNIIYAQWDKQIKEDTSEQRPDFLCMVDPLAEQRDYKRLVIIEIKKPTVKLRMKHVEQIMGYKTILEKHSGKSVDDFTCYIIGREIDPFLKANDLSKSGFITKTYADFIREARRFYEEYKKIIEKESLAF